MLLTMQFLGGLASGFFIPLTLSFILLNTPPKYWAFGIALYALNLELSLNISASLEGWYVEHHSWRWIFWQNVPLALIMSLCCGVVWPSSRSRRARRGCVRAAGGRLRAGVDLRGPRSGQSARLAQLGTGVGVAVGRRLLLAAF
jgi:DHA2 family multidrug resistance protein